MLVDLRKLKPNPLRDFTVDPIDPEKVAELTTSIRDDGFWGGIVCRRRGDGEVEIGAGHHRVEAAIAAGVTTADVFVAEGMDDLTMLRVYARENATQRGNMGTAQVGSVAGAVRLVAKKFLSGGNGGMSVEFNRHAEKSPDAQKSLDVIRGQLASDKGLGREAIIDHLAGTPGINDNTVRQALANIKASGDYARIIREVQEEIERENAEAIEAMRRADAERREAEERARLAEIARKEAADRAIAARQEADRRRAEADRRRAEAKAEREEERRKEAEAAAKAAKVARQEAEAEAKEAHRRRVEAKAAEKAAEETLEKAEEAARNFDGLRKTCDTAARARDVSSQVDKTFDLAGVSQHIKVPSVLDTFREMVTGPGVKPYLAVDQQAALAEHLVRLATGPDDKGRRNDISSEFIRYNLVGLVLQVRAGERDEVRREKEEMLRKDRVRRVKDQQHFFCRLVARSNVHAMRIAREWESWPEGEPFPVLNEFRETLESITAQFNALHERISYVNA